MSVDPRMVIDGLVRRGVPLNAAIGIAGNIAVESGFRTNINEIAPLVPGSRGGYGLIQWTGPRRRQFEEFAGQNLSDLDTQLDFLVHELGTTEKNAANAIYAARTPTEAAQLVSERFLRPGIPHMDRRIAETERLAGSFGGAQPAAPQFNPAAQNALSKIPGVSEGMQNKLAILQQHRPQANMLNVEDFQSRTTFQPQVGFAPSPFQRS